MKTMKIMQVVASVGLLAAGTLFAARGYATEESCDGQEPWGFVGTICQGGAKIITGNKGTANADLSISLQTSAGNFTPFHSGAVGLDASGHEITACLVIDDTADGASVFVRTGCQNAVTVAYEVDSNG